jgi:lysozyme family protein
MTFDSAVEFVLSHEGGLVNDVHDPGGLTRYGISQRAYPDLDIRNLTKDDAMQIYRTDYWDRCRCDELPAGLAILLFDSAVNQGPTAAIRMLQQALRVSADGVIGPVTLAAAQGATKATICEYVARRANTYGLNPNFTRYGLGWSRRLAACHQLALEDA